jgi:hypothetical protein
MVVGPQRDGEAITLINARLYSGFQSSHRAPGFGEPLGKLDLELRGLMRCRCDSGKDVTRQQAHSEPVRIVKNDRVVGGQAKRRGGRHGRSQRALKLRWLHPADFLTAADLRRPRENFSTSSGAPALGLIRMLRSWLYSGAR